MQVTPRGGPRKGAGRPVEPGEGRVKKTKNYGLRLPNKMSDELLAIAEYRGCSIQDLIKEAVTEYLKKR